MLIAALLLAAAVAATAAMLFIMGEGDFRRGRLRAVRRIRSVRRRVLRPLLRRLADAVAGAWTRPARLDVAAQLRRIAGRIERASAGAARFAAAQKDLSVAVAQLEAVGPVSWPERSVPGRRDGREVVAGRGWLVALALGVGGAAVAAGNGWLLYRYVLPEVPSLGVLPLGTVESLPIAAGLAVLPFLLGLAYFALNGAGRALGLRVLAVIAVLLVVALAALEAGAVVVAIEEIGVAAATWWGGIAVATLLGGTAALIPPTTAALAHSAIERFDRWIAARERRAAGRAVVRQDRLAGRLRAAVDDIAGSVESLRGEVVAMGGDPAGRLFLSPGESPSVERAGAVLRRLAAATAHAASPPFVERPPAAEVAIRLLGDAATLAVWLLSSAAALAIAAAGLRHGAEVGTGILVTAGGFAALGTLLLAGLWLRRVFAASASGAGPAVRAAVVAVLGLASASLAYALGSLAAGADGAFFQGRTLMAAAWLNLLVLVAALASARIREGITAAGGAIVLVISSAGWLVVRTVDAALAVLDRTFVGARRKGARSAPARRQRRSTVGALGGGNRRH